MHHTIDMKYFLPATAWLIFILTLSLMPAKAIIVQPTIEGIDKVVHVVFYFILIILISYGFDKIHKLEIQTVIYGIIISTLCGFIIEILQGVLSAQRSFDFYDIIANIVGACIGSVFICKRNNL